MSRILRRPMFRGGKVVSSYGNGIASGLTNKPKRGLVDEPGGYAGEEFLMSQGMFDEFQNQGGSRSYTKYNKPIGPPRGGLKGSFSNQNPYMRMLAKAKNLPGGKRFLVPLLGSTASTLGTAGSAGYGIGALTDFYLKSTDTPSAYLERKKIMQEDPFAYSETDVDVEDKDERIMEKQEIGEAPGFFPQGGKKKFYKDKGLDPETGLPIDDIASLADEGLPGTTKKGEVGNVLNSLLENAKTTKRKNPNDDPIGETSSAKETVEENKKLFAELLGTGKMRRKYGEDVLASISKSMQEGKGFGEAVTDAAQVKSDESKIDQSAAVLAINDYVAGKRSKESMDRILGKVKFTLKEQAKLGALKGGPENWLSDLKKVKDSFKGQQNITDTVVIKDTLFRTTGSNPSVVSSPKKPISQVDPDDLSIGLNIVIAKDGRKIISKDETGAIKDLSRIYPI